MPAFTYEAINLQGKTVRGVIEADTAKFARAELRSKKLVPILVLEATSSLQRNNNLSRYFKSYNKSVFDKAELTIWTRQVASLISAGLQIDRALYSLADDAEKEAVVELMANLLSQVKSGAAFSIALRENPETFDQVYCSVVSAGEETGKLGPVLNSLADDMEALQMLRSKVIGAALYPLIVSALGFLIVVFLMIYVLPQIAGAFENTKQSLPWLTVLMIGVSSFLSKHFTTLIIFFLVSILSFVLILKDNDCKIKFHRLYLEFPLIGKLIKNYNAARFTRILGLLSSAGVPVLDALTSSAETIDNLSMRVDIEHVTTLVREGTPMGLALAQKKSFPLIVSTFAKIGAETGNMGGMLSKVGNQLSDEVQRRAMHLASILEPLLITCMGVIVMFIVLAILMPIIEINSLVN